VHGETGPIRRGDHARPRASEGGREVPFLAHAGASVERPLTASSNSLLRGWPGIRWAPYADASRSVSHVPIPRGF
jgi:hypothetical protein